MATQAICDDNIILTEPGIVGSAGVTGPTTNMWYGCGRITATGPESGDLTITDYYKNGERWATNPTWDIVGEMSTDKLKIQLTNFFVAPVSYNVFIDMKGEGPYLPSYLVTERFKVVIEEVGSTSVSISLINTFLSSSDEEPCSLKSFWDAQWRTLDFSYLLISLDY